MGGWAAYLLYRFFASGGWGWGWMFSRGKTGVVAAAAMVLGAGRCGFIAGWAILGVGGTLGGWEAAFCLFFLVLFSCGFILLLLFFVVDV